MAVDGPSPSVSPPGHVRVTFSLPSTLLVDVDFVCTTLGLSRSSFLAQVLLECAPAMADALRALGPLPPPDTADAGLRLRGASIDMIEERVASAKNMINGLFPPPPRGSDGTR